MIKSEDELKKMAHAGRLLASVFHMLDKVQLMGMSTMAVNDLVDRFITEDLKSRPASKGQYGYAFALNSSVNEVICHGVPSESKILRDGDIVNLDITLENDGFISDSSKTYLIGNVSVAARRLVRVTYDAMWKGIRQVRPGAYLGDIGHAIEKHAKAHGYAVVRDFCGHGIGREMHEAPQIMHFGQKARGETLIEGMTFTIEPMLNQGTAKGVTLDDEWTVVTKDGKLSAQWEHTIAVTKHGFDVLTLRDDEKVKG
ncbi:type I methionyl aminopeptidase [Asticcacaulis machinosus]|uniref:Methionine aminopeptidase n=1 Tax=Asticcacaulis machinosus TaxID=2984211 RepID=A0ABT5HHQ2_9CAUL|nr:type I methionyl aminopeptidase [Asticcacaulis machinosus]MDC7675533.1 type I methionyl aminopeptidase [Asticcacaulis machinosus]